MADANYGLNGEMTDEQASYLTLSSYGTNFLMNYGWYLVGLGIFYLIYRDKINKYLDDWYTRREEQKYAEKYHKNPDLARERLEALTAARQKMQEELNQKAKEAEERRKEREEQKRLEREKLLTGHKLGGSSSQSPYKKEYNPLMGDGGSSYRPPKKSCCKKGGCG
ncbi:selenoprotein S-like [Cimex lectularius]|uniref:Selenoprotein S n=1 Tax=Cimex lectularius TaxID=79782 RepID=A0A8I6RHK2_CIMLE|nr:selenoprotein S-like [Cimex lectularius]